ncbi:MAG: hypothetical protein C4527_17175 [Candidatus Omnitrophota bacterium]|nr:MAG: hypothetical protein C4527_17175 [Candidatus Omnitrophota bacterium]
MKKMSILTVSMVVLCGLVVAPTYAATVFATDTPDIVLAPGTSGDAVFNLNDFFDGAASYTATGGSVNAAGVATVFGQAAPGKLTATFTGGGVSVSSTVQVSNFMIGNGPAIDNNNRLAGVAAGNIFFNGIAPGSSVNSAVALTLPAAGAGGGTPGGVTGGAALIATIGQVKLDVAPSGLRVRTSSVVASGAGAASAGGLTATLNANGSYTLAAASNFEGAWIVTFGASDGASADGVHLLAAPAVAVGLGNAAGFVVMPPGSFAGVTPTFAASGITVNAPQNQGALVISAAPIAVSGQCTVELEYMSNSANVTVAAVAFDGALGPDTVAYANQSGANIAVNQKKIVAVALDSKSGGVSPAFQVFNSGSAAATVTISALRVVKAGPIVDYAMNVNAVAYQDALDSIAGWSAIQGGSAPAAAAGGMALNGAGGFANGMMMVACPAGTIVGEAYVKRTGAAAAGSAFAIVVTDGAINNMSTFVPGASISESGFTRVICSGTNSAATAVNFFVVQCAGFNGTVDSVAVRVVNEKDSYFDATLLGI